jgi:hypothetical protein
MCACKYRIHMYANPYIPVPVVDEELLPAFEPLA